MSEHLKNAPRRPAMSDSENQGAKWQPVGGSYGGLVVLYRPDQLNPRFNVSPGTVEPLCKYLNALTSERDEAVRERDQVVREFPRLVVDLQAKAALADWLGKTLEHRDENGNFVGGDAAYEALEFARRYRALSAPASNSKERTMPQIKPCTSKTTIHDWEHVSDDLEVCRICGQENREVPNYQSNTFVHGANDWPSASDTGSEEVND